MKKSNLIPLILVVSTFLILPIAFFFFNSKNGGNVQGAKTEANKKGIILKITYGGVTYNVVLVPLTNVNGELLEVATFSDL